MRVWQLVIVGIFVHVILFYSIFDIYFTSPLFHGMTPVTVPVEAPAARLVLFVADGLRADKFFEPNEYGKSRASYLRRIIEEEGVWGVSHTRVPTESRPGHVALIAGFYEDVSAVAKGWKENPVDFDSVFNQSRFTWSWGSPDILPMFAKGATGDHVTTNCYPANLEDFAGSDMTLLDTWVFDMVKEFLAEASKNQTLDVSLRQEKIVMFLHLLGIDTHGHSNKPHSREYLNNIEIVDKGIRETVKLINEFYNNDGRTVFLMTADHGMTDWGSHGAGHPHETLTPFLAWGPGVRRPTVSDHCGEFDDTFCTDWHLESLKRSDMEQADIAPLMSYLIGIPLPVNSQGVLPLDVLSADDSVKAEALFANAQQLLAQFQKQTLRHIRTLIDRGRAQDAIQEAHNLIQIALRGLRYYQTYDRLFLGMSIVMGFLGWMGYILHLVMVEHTQIGHQAVSSVDTRKRSAMRQESSALLTYRGSALGCGLLAAVCTGIIVLLYVQSLPLMYYVYCLLPVFLWYKSIEGWYKLGPVIRSLLVHSGFPWSLLLSSLFCLGGLEITVQSFYRRELLSLGLLILSLWPVVSSTASPVSSTLLSSASRFTASGWSLSCVLVAVFPLLPVVGGNSQYRLV
ncbi:GPI ethanolamine phosphate transferase 1 [Plakobranchus ocellatus]|uniref:GPI ethanolamine phosphate transferase 1 n=1 Tax=Plakobranchus ocellatus TaxID=259542 RepID=A0AAV4DSD3_9GAST|nr:GPI ethanolamine phosphate transferase 1 [Plakobranchus ocellatus]